MRTEGPDRSATLGLVPQAPSNKSIDRAGTLLRDWWRAAGDIGGDDQPILDAFNLLGSFREGFAAPLNKVTMGVRSMVGTVGAPVVVSQRLKRVVTTLDKLDRKQNMKLTRMQDVGGCRAILPNQDVVHGVIKRMERSKWTIKSLDDYAVDPKPTGYRAVHVVVVREEHMIEVQLRTERQHLWASTVERFSARPGFEWLKDGNGPPVAVDFFRLTAEIMTLQDLQRPVDRNMMKQVDELRVRLHDLAG